MVISRYQKGIETQNAIIVEAKKIFLEKGYKKTTLSEICRNLNIQFGTITYYFATKLDLLKYIYGDLLRSCYAFVSEHTDKVMNILDLNTTASTIYFIAIFACPITAKFHEHMLETESISGYINDSTAWIYERFNEEFSLGFTPAELIECEAADLGARRERSMQFLSSKESFDFTTEEIELFAYKTNRIMARIFNIDKEHIEHSIEFCANFLDKNDISNIKLF